MSATKSIRRIVVLDESDRSQVIADGPSPDIRTDPARPGFSCARIWVTDRTPIGLKSVRESLHLPHTLVPPAGGTSCYVITFPPEAGYRGNVGAKEVAAYFSAMGEPGASTYAAKAPHPYMQKTRTLDFCLVLDGEITLVLDTGRCTSRPATPSCSAAPITPGAIARIGRARWRSRRTMRRPRCGNIARAGARPARTQRKGGLSCHVCSVGRHWR